MLLRHYTDAFVKVAALVLVVMAALGAGWVYYELSEDLTLGVRVIDADLSKGDQLPMTVEVKVISRKMTDIHIDFVEVKLYAEEDGPLLATFNDFDIDLPAGGEVTRTYDIVLVNLDKVEGTSIWVDATVRHQDGTDHIEEEIDLATYL